MSDEKLGGEPSSPDPNLVKRVEVFMGERAPSPDDAIKIQVQPRKPPVEPLNVPGLESIEEVAEEPAENTEQPAEPQDVDAKPTEIADASIDDEATAKAIQEIAVADSDLALAAATTKTFEPILTPKQASKDNKFKKMLRNKWTWIGLAIATVLLIFIIPYTRYTILGLFIHKNVTIMVVDSKTHAPVSGATVVLAGKSGKTDGAGKAVIKAPLGNQSVTITKQYFKEYTGKYFVGFKTPGMGTGIPLVATGRAVPVLVLDKISHLPISGAEIKALDTSAKTDSQGRATIVLPTNVDTVTATITVAEFNAQQASITVTANQVASNTVYLVPSGKVYFLSNKSGKLDVVKTNLDGSDRQVVIAGTGKEDPNTTSLLASRDWRYVVLKAQRDTAQPSLYLIDTANNDKITNFDNGDATFNLIGWYDHKFMYDVIRNGVSAWQNSHEVIKSYDAERGQLNQLDASQAEGTSTSYAYQSFYNFYIIDDTLTYNAQWYSYSAGAPVSLVGKNDAIRIVSPSGQNKKDALAIDANGVSYIQAALYEPKSAYYGVYNNLDAKSTYYNFTNLTATTTTAIDQSAFNKVYPTYLLAPSGRQVFWSDFRDGKNTLFVGDSNAKNGKQIANETEYAPYGWYSDKYLLVSKNSSELFIMSAAGPTQDTPPLKITNYYKPNQSYPGYGYGYGGI